MNNLVLSHLAQEDLLEIKAYITEELESPEAALRTVEGITKRIRALAAHGELGAQLSSITGIASEYRFLVCGNYLAFYRFEAQSVYVDRILYGRRDFMRILYDTQQKEE